VNGSPLILLAQLIAGLPECLGDTYQAFSSLVFLCIKA
jgi:hypothetical protein